MTMTAPVKAIRNGQKEQHNGVNLQVVQQLLEDVKRDALAGVTRWGVVTRWKGGSVTETQVDGCWIGDKWIERKFTFRTDEPAELGGTNAFANPQEYLMGAFNACIMVGYVVFGAMMGITLESVEIETKGSIDLRGPLQLDPNVPAGYDGLHYSVRIKGDGTEEQFRELHELISRTSPNRYNLSHAIPVTGELIIE